MKPEKVRAARNPLVVLLAAIPLEMEPQVRWVSAEPVVTVVQVEVAAALATMVAAAATTEVRWPVVAAAVPPILVV